MSYSISSTINSKFDTQPTWEKNWEKWVSSVQQNTLTKLCLHFWLWLTLLTHPLNVPSHSLALSSPIHSKQTVTHARADSCSKKNSLGLSHQ